MAHAADYIMAPPDGSYNAEDDSYTLRLDWVIQRIGASEFQYIDVSLARKVLRHDSQYRKLIHVLPARIFQWLCGRPLMVAMRFPADWFG